MTRLLPYLQLVRIPNVFTAMADIFMAALVTSAVVNVAGYVLPFLLVLLSSSCLYLSGMVWNDFFDVRQDERERPFRPLPSGKVPLRTALLLASGLMAAGIVLALLADVCAAFRLQSGLIAVLLSANILLYDAWLKRTPLGPAAMGGCRFFNVLLGLSVVQVFAWGLVLALVVGIYIAGVTWFARTEARESQRPMLTGAAALLLMALALSLTLPAIVPVPREDEYNRPESPLVYLGQLLFPYLLAAFGIFVGIPITRAIQFPYPAEVQKAVKRCLFGLVLLDAILASAFVGPPGLLLVLLLVPAVYLGRWVYST